MIQLTDKSMKKKQLIIALATLTILAASIGGASSVYAAANNPNGKKIHNKSQPLLTVAQKNKIDAVQTALKNSDYKAWVIAEKDINPNSPLLAKVNEGNFSRYVEAYNLLSKADAIMKDLGLGSSEKFDLGEAGDFDGHQANHLNRQRHIFKVAK